MNKILFATTGNWLFELQPAVMLQCCKITAGCNFNHDLLQTKFHLFSVCWIKANGVIYIPIMFCQLTDQRTHHCIGLLGLVTQLRASELLFSSLLFTCFGNRQGLPL